VNNMSKKIYLFIFFAPLFLVGCAKLPLTSTVNENIDSAAVRSAVKPGQVALIDENIIVTEPLSNALVASPLAVKGQITNLTGVVFFQLKDQWDNVIATSSVVLNLGNKEWRNYQVNLSFSRPSSQKGILQAYMADNKEISNRNLITIPLIFKEFEKPIIKVYFSNIKEDPELKNCSKVYPAEWVFEPTSQILDAALEALFGGVNEEEMKAGFVTNLPEKEKGVKVQKIEIKEDKAYVDFNQALQAGVSGACRVAAIKSQIIETLKQFSNIKDVVISIDGKTKGILKP